MRHRGHSTEESTFFVSEIMRARGWQRAIVVSDAYRLWRANLLLGKVGVETYPSPVHDVDYLIIESTYGDRHPDPFGFKRMRYIRDVEDSKELHFLREPAVIISASGMCEAGRILHHLKNNIEDSRNTVLIVGWQAPHTLGRKLVEHWERVRIFGQDYQLRAEVEVIGGYSAHADRDELLDYVRPLNNGQLKKAFVLHGEEEASLALADEFHELGVPDVTGTGAHGGVCPIRNHV